MLGIAQPVIFHPRQFFFIELLDGPAFLNDFALALGVVVVGSNKGDGSRSEYRNQQQACQRLSAQGAAAVQQVGNAL